MVQVSKLLKIPTTNLFLSIRLDKPKLMMPDYWKFKAFLLFEKNFLEMN